MIQYEHVTKIFGSGPKAVTAVNEVSMEIEKGNLATFQPPALNITMGEPTGWVPSALQPIRITGFH
jgi:hypothetical protein